LEASCAREAVIIASGRITIATMIKTIAEAARLGLR